MNVHEITAPVDEPITLEEARLHLKLDAEGSPQTHPDDELVESLISAARQSAESFLDARIAEWVLEYRIGSFASEIVLPDPIVSLESVTYIDTAGVTQTVAADDYELAGSPSRPVLRPVYDGQWPTDVRSQDDAVRVRYTTGYTSGSPDARPLPAAIRAAMLLTIGNLYENRESVVIGTISSELPMGVTHLLMPYRRHMGP